MKQEIVMTDKKTKRKLELRKKENTSKVTWQKEYLSATSKYCGPQGPNTVVCNAQILLSAAPNTVVCNAQILLSAAPNTVVSSAKYCNVFITPKYCCQQRPIKILLSAAPNTVVCNV
ncbi:hypothetical protein RRG08_018410 [Elysia crispata]|uniref:Uncharacterized protein n=1 Tax=Elysia crispata TaxID=231223 RepID=A0AAE0YKI4_9GAST|nr:hypothetical protein RRG08_018410 [Elysia crispata]